MCEHALVLGDFCFLGVRRFDGFCVLSFRIGDVQNLSSRLRCHFRDSGCLVPDFLSNPHPFFRSALRLTWPLTEASTLSHWRRGILRLSLTAAVRCLFPSDFQHISTKLLFPPCRAKVRASCMKHNSPRQSCARISVNSEANRFLEGRGSYGWLLCRTAKSAARPAGTTCHCGFNSSVQPLPVNGVLLTSAGAGT